MFLFTAAIRVGESLYPNFGHLKLHGFSGLLISGPHAWLIPIPGFLFSVDLDWLLYPKIMYLPVISLLINLA